VVPLPDRLATRADFQRFAAVLWQPAADALRTHGVAANFARPGETVGRSAALEAFARPLLGYAALSAGGGGNDDWALVRRVLVEGIDPASPHFWGEAADWAQPCVEMGALGVALRLAPDELAGRLTPGERARLVTWLQGIERVKLVENNWRFFRVLVHVGLRALGSGLDRAVVAADLARLESFAREDGWYADGDGGSRDHYVGWAFHFYGLIYARHGADEEPAVAARFRARARAFAPQFAAWFASDGAALPIGRSLCYRFAQAAPWGALAYADEPALPWGQLRGLWARHLRAWARLDIRDAHGRLSRGYAYENPALGESYNAPASPYWANKALLPLALPESHPFWQAEEEAPPTAPDVFPQPGGLVTVCRDDDAHHTFALAAGNLRKGRGMRHSQHKYGKFAYSAAFGWAAGPDGVDSTLGLRRCESDPWECAYDTERPSEIGRIVKRHWEPWPGVTLTTWLIPVLPGHVRVHRLESTWTLDTCEGGFAHAVDAAPTRVRSEIFDLELRRARQTVTPAPGSHLLFPTCVTPVLRGRTPLGVTWLATAVYARPGGGSPDEAAAWRARLAWTREPVPRLTWDGAELWRAPVAG
jgi:hypothetical protein